MDPTVTWLVALIKEVGFPIAIAAYFIYRDLKFMGALQGLMTRIDAFLDTQGVKGVQVAPSASAPAPVVPTGPDMVPKGV